MIVLSDYTYVIKSFEMTFWTLNPKHRTEKLKAKNRNTEIRQFYQNNS